jgi:transcriptional regulator with XRE-family HTH domain
MLNLQVKDAVPESAYAFENMETMGDRIRQLREGHRLTQTQLGQLCGVTKSAVSQWENGPTKNLKLDPFLRMLEVLHTDANYVFWGKRRPGAAPGVAAVPKRKPPGES